MSILQKVGIGVAYLVVGFILAVSSAWDQRRAMQKDSTVREPDLKEFIFNMFLWLPILFILMGVPLMERAKVIIRKLFE